MPGYEKCDLDIQFVVTGARSAGRDHANLMLQNPVDEPKMLCKVESFLCK
jgi:hypothetical protein